LLTNDLNGMYQQRLTNKFKLKGTHTKCEYAIMGQFYKKMTRRAQYLNLQLILRVIKLLDCKISIRK